MSVQVLKGKQAIKKLFQKTLENKEKFLRSALCGKPLVYFVDEEFADYYMDKRTNQKIHLQSLRFTKKEIDAAKHKDYKKYDKEVRVAPQEALLQKSMLIWDDIVATVQTKTLQVNIIEDKENAKAKKKWFDEIWQKSR